MKKIFFIAVLVNILLYSACKPNPYKYRTAYIVTNNTSDSVSLQFKASRYVSDYGFFKKDSVYRIATLLKGQSKTLYTVGDSAQQSVFYQSLTLASFPEKLADGKPNPYYAGTMYAVKGSGGDTIRASSKEFPSLSNQNYWKKNTNPETATATRTLTLH